MKIETIDGLMKLLGASSPWMAGRNLYKHVSCGPWMTFLVEDAPATAGTIRACIKRTRGDNLHLMVEEGYDDPPEGVVETLARLFGFDEWATRKGRIKGYTSKLKGFLGRNPVSSRGGITFKDFTIHENGHPDGDHDPNPKCLWITLTYRVDAKVGSVYYEDESASRPIANCIGVKVGSIVEGSDVEIGPEEMLFPFDSSDFWKMVENINEEACFYWKERNDHVD